MRSFISRSPLAFPGGIPGFDPSHRANNCQGQSFVGSFVATDGPVFTCLNLPIQGAKGGAPTFANTEIGPTFLSSGTNQSCTFANGFAPAAPVACTVAAIIIPNSSQASGDVIVQTGASGSQVNSLNLNSLIPIMAQATAIASSGITLSLNVPYFVAASASGAAAGPGQVNFVVLNLKSGSVQVATAAPASGVQSFFSPWSVGGTTGNFLTTGARVAAAMASNAKLSIPELLMWAADPWAYWYPDMNEVNFVAAAAVAAIPYNPWPLRAPVLAQ